LESLSVLGVRNEKQMDLDRVGTGNIYCCDFLRCR